MHIIRTNLIVGILATLVLSLGCAGPTFLSKTPGPSFTGTNKLSPIAQSNYFYLQYLFLSKNKKTRQAFQALTRAVQLNPNPDLYLELAFFLARQGKKQDSIKILQEALQKFPANKDLGLALAQFYLNSNNLPKAIALLQNLHTKKPADQDVLLNLARLYLKQKQFTKALDVLQNIPETSMTPQAHFILARSYAGTGNSRAAIRELRQCLKQNPNYLEAWAELAYQYEMSGDYLQAEQTYSSLLHKGINNRDIISRLIELNLKLNNPDRALSFVQSYPKDSTFILNAVSMFMRSGFWLQAKKLLHTLPQGDLARPNAIIFRALIAEQADNNPERAIAILDTLDPNTPQFFKGLSYKCQLLVKLRDYASALKACELGIKKFPQKDDFWLLKSQILAMQKKYVQAKKVIDQGRHIFPHSQKLLFQYGVVEYELGHKEKSLSIMEEIIKKNPEHAQALNFIGYTLTELGKDLTRAKLLINKALELDPNNGYYLDSLAWLYFKNGQLKQAWQEIQKALTQVKDDPTLWEHYADIALALGETDKARHGYQKSLQFEPRDPKTIQKKLADLSKN